MSIKKMSAATKRSIIAAQKARWARIKSAPAAAAEKPQRTCVMCGCTDNCACPSGCSWSHLFEHGNVGVCSCCVKKFMGVQAKAMDETRDLFPVVLYLATLQEADEMIAAVRQANPNLSAQHLE